MLKFLVFLIAMYGTVCWSGMIEEEGEELSGQKLMEFLRTKPKLWESDPSHDSEDRQLPRGYVIDQVAYPFANYTFEQQAKYRHNSVYDEEEKIPKEFDSRKKWPYCSSLIGIVHDQASCHSCWAVSMASVASDRLCIQTEGRVKVQLSSIDLTTCCPECGVGSKVGGCSSGEPYKAWQHFRDVGLVSGGSYSNWTGCRPYWFKECNAGPQNGYKWQCDYSKIPETPKCRRYCQDNHWRSYKEDKYYGSEIYYPRTERAMQLEIMKRGPIQVIFDVYKDFDRYKSGVYYHTWGTFMASHVVKIFGWGKENGVPYWLGVNSWNVGWGNRGFFKFARGVNMCGIERWPVAGSIDLDRLPSSKHEKKNLSRRHRKSKG